MARTLCLLTLALACMSNAQEPVISVVNHVGGLPGVPYFHDNDLLLPLGHELLVMDAGDIAAGKVRQTICTGYATEMCNWQDRVYVLTNLTESFYGASIVILRREGEGYRLEAEIYLPSGIWNDIEAVDEDLVAIAGSGFDYDSLGVMLVDCSAEGKGRVIQRLAGEYGDIKAAGGLLYAVNLNENTVDVLRHDGGTTLSVAGSVWFIDSPWKNIARHGDGVIVPGGAALYEMQYRDGLTSRCIYSGTTLLEGASARGSDIFAMTRFGEILHMRMKEETTAKMVCALSFGWGSNRIRPTHDLATDGTRAVERAESGFHFCGLEGQGFPGRGVILTQPFFGVFGLSGEGNTIAFTDGSKRIHVLRVDASGEIDDWATLDTDLWIKGIAVHGNTVYVSGESSATSKLLICEVANRLIETIAEYELPAGHPEKGLAWDNETLYLALGTSVLVLDVRDPHHPRELERWSPGLGLIYDLQAMEGVIRCAVGGRVGIFRRVGTGDWRQLYLAEAQVDSLYSTADPGVVGFWSDGQIVRLQVSGDQVTLKERTPDPGWHPNGLCLPTGKVLAYGASFNSDSILLARPDQLGEPLSTWFLDTKWFNWSAWSNSSFLFLGSSESGLMIARVAWPGAGAGARDTWLLYQ